MAKAEEGLFGPMKGKIKNTMLTTWKGIPVIKGAPVRTAPPTEREAINRRNFQLSNEWLSPLTPLLRIGFKNYTPTNEGFSAAKSYMAKNALIKDGNNSYIDPALMKVSYGSLKSAENTQMDLNAEKQLLVSWDTSISQNSSRLDQVLLLAYNVDKKVPVTLLGGKFRQDGSASLNLANQQPGQYHVYLAFVAENRESQSDSVYLGMIEVGN